MNKLKNQKPRCPKDTNLHQNKYKKTNKKNPTRNQSLQTQKRWLSKYHTESLLPKYVAHSIHTEWLSYVAVSVISALYWLPGLLLVKQHSIANIVT